LTSTIGVTAGWLAGGAAAGVAGAGVETVAATGAGPLAETCAVCVVTARWIVREGLASAVADLARVTARFGAGVVAVVSAAGVSGVAESVASGALLVVVVVVADGEGGATVGIGCVLAGASCAPSWVEESAKTAAIAAAPVRAYSFVVVLIMMRQQSRPPRGVAIIVVWKSYVDEQKSCSRMIGSAVEFVRLQPASESF
jgi:hypothetical protein